MISSHVKRRTKYAARRPAEKHPARRSSSAKPQPVLGEDGNRVVICQLKVALPRGLWSREISKRHPDAIFDITDRMPWSKGKTLAVIRVYDQATWNIVEELRALKGVYNVEEWPTEDSVKEFHIVHDTPIFLNDFVRFGVLQRTPIRFKDGVSNWEVVGTYSKIQNLLRSLRRLPMSVAMDPLYRTSETIMPLHQNAPTGTARQLASRGDSSGHYIVCKVRIRFPPPYWDSGVFEKHPDARIDILGYALSNDELHVDMRIHSDNLQAIIDDFRISGVVRDVKPLGRAAKATTLRVVFRKHEFFSQLNEMHLLLRTPATIQNGYSEVIMAGPDESIKRLMKMFPSPQLQIEAVYDTEKEDEAILTPRQTEIFHKAMAAGYFDVPRRVTLTELAARVGVAVSSLSEMLAVVEKKLLQDPRTINHL
jgi:predicted DNA binding protein